MQEPTNVWNPNAYQHQYQTPLTPTTPDKYIMVFDVETTGLIPKCNKSNKENPFVELTLCPHILQLSWVIYDVENKCIIQTYNTYIRPTTGTVISEFITNLTGITQDMCEKKGIPIIDALEHMYRAYINCNCIIAHNLEFDRSMIRIELLRHAANIRHSKPHLNILFHPKYNEDMGIHTKCTMRMSIDLCNIYKLNSKNQRFLKFPKLSELYQKLFDEVPQNLHNSLVDTIVCLRCYLMIQSGESIHIESDVFNRLLINCVSSE